MIGKNSMKHHFYSYLIMEDIINADYTHAKRVCKDFGIKNLGKYYDLYVQSMLADVLQNFLNLRLVLTLISLAFFLQQV